MSQEEKWLPSEGLLKSLQEVYKQLPFDDSILVIGKPEAMGGAHERGQIGPVGENFVFEPSSQEEYSWLLHFRANDQDPSQRPSDAMNLIYAPEHVKQLQNKWDQEKKAKTEQSSKKKKRKSGPGEKSQ